MRRRVRPIVAVSVALAILVVMAALLAPLLAPYDPLAQSVVRRFRPPSATNLLGTDQFGRDVLSRILYGLRASLGVAGGAVAAALAVGGTLGLAAGYFGGWTDRLAMRAMDVLFAFPVMLLAIGIIAVLGPGAVTTAAAIGIVYTPIFARLIRAPAIVLAGSDYVAAARVAGASDWRIIARHLLPNLASVVIVQTSLLLSAAILVEASLSFLGLGAQPPSPSLGTMLSEGRNVLLISPWGAVFSGLAILVLAFVLNLVGDVLRDELDPRLRGSG